LIVEIIEICEKWAKNGLKLTFSWQNGHFSHFDPDYFGK